MAISKLAKDKHGVNRNWIINGYFIGGGAGYGVLPVNMRGLSSYAVSGHMNTIDGWTKNSAVYVTLQSDCIELTRSEAGDDNFSQYFDNPTGLAGRTCIFSALVSGDSGTKINLGYNVDGGDNQYGIQYNLDSSPQLLTLTTLVPASPVNMRVIFRGSWPDTTSKIKLYAAKLELGDEQTLAHQENGAWVINDVPDYDSELIRCMASKTADNHLFATTEMIGPAEYGAKAANAYTGAGKLFTWNGYLYTTKTAIAVNDTLAEGANCERTTLAELLNM